MRNMMCNQSPEAIATSLVITGVWVDQLNNQPFLRDRSSRRIPLPCPTTDKESHRIVLAWCAVQLKVETWPYSLSPAPQSNYPVRVRTAGLCIWLRQFVYVSMYVCMHVCMYVCMYVYMYMCVYMRPKNSVLSFKKFLLSVLYYLILEFKRLQSGCLCPASCIDEAIRVCSI